MGALNDDKTSTDREARRSGLRAVIKLTFSFTAMTNVLKLRAAISSHYFPSLPPLPPPSARGYQRLYIKVKQTHIGISCAESNLSDNSIFTAPTRPTHYLTRNGDTKIGAAEGLKEMRRFVNRRVGLQRQCDSRLLLRLPFWRSWRYAFDGRLGVFEGGDGYHMAGEPSLGLNVLGSIWQMSRH